MAFYSDEQLEQVRSATDIVELIGSHVRLKRVGGGYVGLCPFHNEKTPSFHVNQVRQMYKCFGCGVGGSVFTFVMEYENFTFPEAVEYLADRAGITLPKEERSKEQKKQDSLRIALLEINAKAARFFYAKLKSPQGKLGYNYLSSRGLSDKTILHFGLGYAGQGNGELYNYLRSEGYDDNILKETGLFKMDERGVFEKFWNRVMFPIMDVNNRVIGFGGRVMGDGKPKYMNSPETKIFDKSRNLFGLNFARQGKREYLILCEGYMDVIALHQAGFTGAVASLGTAFTEEQAVVLKRYTKEVYLTYDSDNAGVKAALRAIPILRDAGIVSKVVNMQPYKDPDELIKALGAEGFEERISKACNSFFFEIEIEKNSRNLEDPEQRTDFYHTIAKKLLVFEEKVKRDNYLDAVSAKYSIKKEDLQGLVLRYGNQMHGQYKINNSYKSAKENNSGIGRSTKDGQGIHYSYRMLLSWLAAEPHLFGEVSRYIAPEDFLDETYREVAVLLYEQLRAGTSFPAKIVDHFQDIEKQKLVAAMFQTNFPVESSGGESVYAGEVNVNENAVFYEDGFANNMKKEEKEKAINELVYVVKQHSLDRQIRELTDISELQRLILEKKKLQSPENLHISL